MLCENFSTRLAQRKWSRDCCLFRPDIRKRQNLPRGSIEPDKLTKVLHEISENGVKRRRS